MNYSVVSFLIFAVESLQSSSFTYSQMSNENQKCDINDSEINYRNLETTEYDVCELCRNKGSYENIRDDLEEQLKLIENENYELLDGYQNDAYEYTKKSATFNNDDIEKLISMSNVYVSNVVNKYNLPMTENGIINTSFYKKWISMYETIDCPFKLDEKSEVLFVNSIFLTINYIKEILDLLKKVDVERKLILNFQYNTMNEILDYLNLIFCDVTVLEKDKYRINYYVHLARSFLQRMVGSKGALRRTSKCRLTKFLIQNIKNSKIFYFKNVFESEDQKNKNISKYLVERVIQAVDLHFF